jgi:hypothetical protein
MDTYNEGYSAFHRGTDRMFNPWAQGSREQSEWFRGWDAASRKAVR